MPQEDRIFRYLAHINHQHNEKIGASSYPHDADELPRISNALLLPEYLRAKEGFYACPYCSTDLVTKRREHVDPFQQQRLAYDSTVVSKTCHRCSWWYLQVEYTADHHDFELVDRGYETYEGIISRFSNDLWRQPILFVEQELREYRKGLASVSGHEMEKIVGQLIAQYEECEVRHIGRTSDGGIDLLIVKGETTTAVQVKHRGSGRARKSEGIECVREFVGALVVEQYSRGLFVTTDAAFSKPAKDYAKKVSRVFIPLELATISDLRSMIGNIQQKQWNEHNRLWKDKTGER
jgi:Restriction endonuclease